MFFSERSIEIFLNILVIFFISSLLFWVLDFFLQKFSYTVQRLKKQGEEQDQRIHTLTTLIRAITRATIIFIAGSMGLQVLQVDVAPILAGAGILGVMATFSTQTLIKDILAGLFILLEGKYYPGMVITLDESKGMVEHVSLRQTVLKDEEGNMIYIPNGSIKVVTILASGKKRTGRI